MVKASAMENKLLTTLLFQELISELNKSYTVNDSILGGEEVDGLSVRRV